VEPINTEILSRLENLTQELWCSDAGRVKPFIWEVAQQGELTTKNLLLFNEIWDRPSVKQVDLEAFSERLKERGGAYYSPIQLNEQRVRSLLDILQSKLTDLEIYLCYFPDVVFDIYIGKTQNDLWFGVCTPVEYEYRRMRNRFNYAFRAGNSENLLIKSSVVPDSDIIELQDPLMEEGFYPGEDMPDDEIFRWEIGESSDEVLEKILLSFKFLIVQEFQDIQEFVLNFDVNLRSLKEEGPWEKEIDVYIDPVSGEASEIEVDSDTPIYPRSKDYRELDSFLKCQLTNLRIYSIGVVLCHDYNVYVVGNTPTGDWAGVVLNAKSYR
jgi:Nuclease A inhibitor-like protein